MNRLRWCALALLGFVAWCAPDPVFAQDYVPGLANRRVARFPAGATAVVVDVYNVDTATQVGNNVATTRIQLDSANTDAFTFDLSAVSGYPTDCTPTTFFLRWIPDSADCAATGTPGTCVEETVYVGGVGCRDQGMRQVSVTKTSVVKEAQGVTQAIIDYYARRGETVQLWRTIKVAYDGNFASPDYTVYEVFFYTASGTAATPFSCGVMTSTDPSGMSTVDLQNLQSACSGN